MERDNEGFEIDLDRKVVETTMFSNFRRFASSKRRKEFSNDGLFKEYGKRKSKWRHL